ncbi:MAG: T9SS type A sorting domain-containing protein [Ignavibacteria bacterium]|nr:T9SS type A sorting domain-containing protein [Ignavibacteria bacterium]
MNHLKTTMVLMLLLVLFISSSTFSQDNPYKLSREEQRINSMDLAPITNSPTLSTGKTQRTVSQQESAIVQEMKVLKESGNPANRDRIIELQKQIDAITGNSVTRTSNPYVGGGTSFAGNPVFYDNPLVNASRIFSGAVKGIATCTEQLGSTAGKIWVAVGVPGPTTGGDTVKIFSSVDNGITWTLNYYAWLGGTDRIQYDQMDIELIESASGTKYFHLIYGLRSTNGTGNYFAGGWSFSSASAGNLWGLAWPGGGSVNRYYNPRLTSDNAQYPTNAYIYVVASYDSTISTGHYNSQRFAYMLNPYSTTPAITYTAGNVYWNSTTAILEDLQSDIAWFRNSNDSLMFSYSNCPDSTKIFFSKMAVGTYVGGSAGGFIGGTQSTDRKSHASLSTNGNSNGSAICIFNQITGGFQSVKYFRTTNFSFAGTINESVLMGPPAGTAYAPGITGIRKGDSHYFGYIYYGTSVDTLRLTKVTMGGAFTVDRVFVNPNIILTATCAPRPGWRNVSNDSCFVVYCGSGPSNVWASGGCTGTVTGIGGNQTPVSYKLEQNYPNPFNPVTKISYALPVQGLVTLRVYDILGKEVATLVNETKNPGSYTVEFNASNLSSGVYFYKLESNSFSDIKKLMLIK